MTDAEGRRLARIVKAAWIKDINAERFIFNYMNRKGIPYLANTCPFIKENGMTAIIKEFKRIGCGGVGLVWGCSQCRNGPSYIGRGSSARTSLPVFGGMCKMEMVRKDADKLIIIPRVPKDEIPYLITNNRQRLDTGNGEILTRNIIYAIDSLKSK